jgi:hypothetical protein
MAIKCGSAETSAVGGLLLVKELELLGPCIPARLPVVIAIPDEKGKLGFELVKYPIFGAVNAASTKTPFTLMLKIDTPAPEN